MESWWNRYCINILTITESIIWRFILLWSRGYLQWRVKCASQYYDTGQKHCLSTHTHRDTFFPTYSHTYTHTHRDTLLTSGVKVSSSDSSGTLICTLDIQCELHCTLRTEVNTRTILQEWGVALTWMNIGQIHVAKITKILFPQRWPL